MNKLEEIKKRYVETGELTIKYDPNYPIDNNTDDFKIGTISPTFNITEDIKWLLERLEEQKEFLSGLKCGWGPECGDEQDVGCIEGGAKELLGKLEGK